MMITQDLLKPIDPLTVLQKNRVDKAQWVKAKEKEFPFPFKQKIQNS